jgi:hypothetical protein
MADSSAFVWMCEELETKSGLSRLEARGTVRLALKEAGLRGEDLTPSQAATVAQHVLPAELSARRVADVEALCQHLAQGVQALADERSGASPDEIFSQMSS